MARVWSPLRAARSPFLAAKAVLTIVLRATAFTFLFLLLAAAVSFAAALTATAAGTPTGGYTKAAPVATVRTIGELTTLLTALPMSPKIDPNNISSRFIGIPFL